MSPTNLPPFSQDDDMLIPDITASGGSLGTGGADGGAEGGSTGYFLSGDQSLNNVDHDDLLMMVIDNVLSVSPPSSSSSSSAAAAWNVAVAMTGTDQEGSTILDNTATAGETTATAGATTSIGGTIGGATTIGGTSSGGGFPGGGPYLDDLNYWL